MSKNVFPFKVLRCFDKGKFIFGKRYECGVHIVEDASVGGWKRYLVGSGGGRTLSHQRFQREHHKCTSGPWFRAQSIARLVIAICISVVIMKNSQTQREILEQWAPCSNFCPPHDSQPSTLAFRMTRAWWSPYKVNSNEFLKCHPVQISL